MGCPVPPIVRQNFPVSSRRRVRVRLGSRSTPLRLPCSVGRRHAATIFPRREGSETWGHSPREFLYGRDRSLVHFKWRVWKPRQREVRRLVRLDSESNQPEKHGALSWRDTPYRFDATGRSFRISSTAAIPVSSSSSLV